MTFELIDVPQRSEAWFDARLGRLTGSVADQIMKVSRKKGAESISRRDLRLRLACERITHLSQEDSFISREMQRGLDLEAAAIAAYELRQAVMVRRAGFLSLDGAMAGCSLDGYVGTLRGPRMGILEVKCPKSATHLRYLRGRALPDEYRAQIRHNLWVTGGAWADFVSFDDRFPAPLQLFVHRVPVADLDVAGYDLIARMFLAEVEQEVASLASLAKA